MFQHILIATDGSELAEKAVTEGLNLASRLSARVLAVTVAGPWTMMGGPPPTPSLTAAYEHSRTQHAQQITSHVLEQANKSNVACSSLVVTDKYPTDGILEAAANNGCDLIVMASHGRGALGRFLLGSIATDVLVHSHIPVLICR